MSQQTTGRAALVANNLPSAKTITGATNASPIVITAAAHGVKVNEIVLVSGVGGNTAANGTFIAGAVTTNTVTLLAFPAGTATTGSGAYTSGGSLQSLGFGLTVPVPNDLTDVEQAGTVNVPFEALIDFAAYLLYRAGPSGTLERAKVDRAGDTMTGDLNIPNNTLLAKYAEITRQLSMTGSFSGSSATLPFETITAGADGGTSTTCSTTELKGRKKLWRDRVTIADGNKKVSTVAGTGIDYHGDRFTLPASTAAARTITVATAGAMSGETMTFFCAGINGALAGTQVFLFSNDDGGTTRAAQYIAATNTSQNDFWLTLEFNGTTWQLAESSGVRVDQDPATKVIAEFGVYP